MKAFRNVALGLAALLLAALPAGAQTTTYTGPYNSDIGAVVTLSSASASGTSSDQTNLVHRGLKCMVHISAISGTSPTLTVSLRYKDGASSQYGTLLTSASLTATGNTVLTVYPGVGVTSNVSASDYVPRTWDISYTIGGTSPSVSGTIGCNYLN